MLVAMTMTGVVITLMRTADHATDRPPPQTPHLTCHFAGNRNSSHGERMQLSVCENPIDLYKNLNLLFFFLILLSKKGGMNNYIVHM